MQRILVTGASGLLGSHLAHALGCRFTVAAGFFRRVPPPGTGEPIRCDLRDNRALQTVLDRFRPDTLIHCAAQADVDLCQRDPRAAYALNTESTRCLARYAGRNRVHLAFVSTDSVFDGKKGSYTEDSPTGPLNVYGQTKLEAERAVRQEAPEHLIVRTNFYGKSPLCDSKKNLAEWILQRFQRNQTVAGFQDVFFSPLFVNDLVGCLVRMLEMGLKGTYHLGARERISKFSFARLLAEVFEQEPDQVRPSFLKEALLDAPRPKDTSLAVAKATQSLGKPMPSVREGLIRFRRLYHDSCCCRA